MSKVNNDQTQNPNSMAETLINRVANSSIQTIDLAQFLPQKDFVVFDIKEYLFQGLILKEKDFRTSLKTSDWSSFDNKIALVICSVDAIIPQWAYALISTTLSPFVSDVFVGTEQEYIKAHYKSVLDHADFSSYQDKPIILKGCGDTKVPAEAFSIMALKLQGIAKSIMYGEACSAVPVYKKPRQ